MHISPSLLLLTFIIFLFFPPLQEWMIQGGTAWYRPYLLWLATIILVWWGVQRYIKKMDKENGLDKNANEL
jgi:hypothetical protein